MIQRLITAIIMIALCACQGPSKKKKTSSRAVNAVQSAAPLKALSPQQLQRIYHAQRWRRQSKLLERQLSQNMSYFCMVKRNRFPSPQHCRAFVDKHHRRCSEKNGRAPSKKLVQCVLRGLK